MPIPPFPPMPPIPPMPGGGSSAGSGDGTAGAHLEESIEFWMLAYPRRWRELRGEELRALVVDLAGPDARRLGAHAVFDLVRGGWATRIREHPPLHTWLAYRILDRRIHVAYRSWALDDIDGFLYPLRIIWPAFLPFVAVTEYPASPDGVPAFVYACWVFALVSSLFLWPERRRSRARLKHVAPRPGEPVVGHSRVAGDVPHHRVTERSTLTWAVLLLWISGTGSVVSALFAPKVILFIPVPGMDASWEIVVAPVGGHRAVAVAILVTALGVGGLAALMARRRLRRFLPDRPNQPFRVLRPLSAPAKVKVLAVAAIVVALTGLEVIGWIVLGLSVVTGAVTLLLLPGALVALVVTRRATLPDLAGSDVWWIATRGQLPNVDWPVRALRPPPRPAREGAGVQSRDPAVPPYPTVP